jgi:hypothetical protein
MDREVELHAVITPMASRIYPVTRSHFSMGFLLLKGRIRAEKISNSLKKIPLLVDGCQAN